MSPIANTASKPVSSDAVEAAVQIPLVPCPLLNADADGSQAMSPAAPMTGSALGWTCTVVVSTGSVLPALSTEKNLNVVGWVIVKPWPFQTGLEVVGVDPSVV